MPEASTRSCQSAPVSAGFWSSAQASRNCSSEKWAAGPAILPQPGYSAPSAGHPLALREIGGGVPQPDWQGAEKEGLGRGGRTWEGRGGEQRLRGRFQVSRRAGLSKGQEEWERKKSRKKLVYLGKEGRSRETSGGRTDHPILTSTPLKPVRPLPTYLSEGVKSLDDVWGEGQNTNA